MKYLIYIFLALTFLFTSVSCQENHQHAVTANGTTYTCPMHPQIIKNEPGSCPVCNMDLVPVSQSKASASEAALMLSDNQILLGNITTQPVQTGQAARNIVLTGRLVPDETQVDLISSRAAGRIEKLYVKETGVPIRKGQPLYDLYSENLLTLEQEYLLTLEQNKALGQEETRYASFLEAARKKLLLFGLTESQIQNLSRAGRPDARITFLAPRSGIVTEIAAAEGIYVPEGGLLYRLTNLNKIWVEAELYAGEAATVKPGDLIQISVAGVAPVKARVAFVNPEFRQNSQVVLLRAEMLNTQGNLLPGMPATVSLLNTSEKQLLLPQEAIIRTQEGAHVWVKTGKNTFSPRLVSTGESGTNNIAIKSGLSAGDTVVVTGAYLLYSEYVLKNGNVLMASHQH
ncbi:efflux RND transporter periplasmic adaptor subunit [Adhaeribacter rhizoryzae]|uniref:Efflux RND transporter periplasmic adaptor subunit n=1 Tax=Adhaeribacter rhizoryzae TaxID=2607907 RepID=A0A5M6DBD1_9BACT|nr:efflux RND transporter periplasmic adaptor subunit [Adhaeribacter rhizoryzae]KAA5544864.1 efflux RND transporter periplasmic adaptor subunit [Adhaeribacter rhizoryzae]